MLIARTRDGQLINLLDEAAVKGERYVCPACGQAVRLKQGKIMRAHFAHISLEECDFFQENESAEHLTLKALLYRSLVANHYQVEIEKVLPELGLIADLLVENRIVLEVQCSRLSQERLKQRTQAYHQAGYQVIWLLGEKLWLGQRLSPLQKNFLYFSQNMGFHLWELDVDKEVIQLHYLLHEDFRGRVVGLTKQFSLSEDMLMILRQPFVSQPLQQMTVKLEPNPRTYVQSQLVQKNPKWLKRQAKAYQEGDNLLTWSDEDFYPQVCPVAGEEFCQIGQDLSAYHQQFMIYYEKEGTKSVQTVFSPRFYGIMKANSSERTSDGS